MGRKWRRNLTVRELPDSITALEQFSGLISSLLDIITGKSYVPSSLHHWFYKDLAFKVFKQTKYPSVYTMLLLRERIDSVLDVADIKQQSKLFLLEIIEFFRAKIRPGKPTKYTLYDYVRFNLVRYLAKWIAHQILSKTMDYDFDHRVDIVEPEDPSLFELGLGWVTLKSNQGMFGLFSTRQKYLLYLRYSKGFTIKEIASLTGRHRSLIEKDFSLVNKILGIGGHYVNSRDAC
jgi:hypothetical protein